MATEPKSDILSPEVLENQEGGLSEEQNEAIARSVLEEEASEEGTPEKKKEPEDTKEEKPEETIEEETTEEVEEKPEEKSDEELLEAEDADLGTEELKRKEELTSAKAESRKTELFEKKEEDLTVEEKAEKTQITETEEKAKVEALNVEIVEFAKEKNIPENEARSIIESEIKIGEKYEGDTKKIIRAYRNMQVNASKLEVENKALKESAAKPSEDVIINDAESMVKMIDDGKLKFKGKVLDREGVVEDYREAFPKICTDLTDDAILRLATRDMVGQYRKNQEDQTVEDKKQAIDKRAKLVEDLTGDDKKFAPDVERALKELADPLILNEEFDVATFVSYAKGQYYDQHIKKAREEGIKQGKEDAKVVAEIKPPAGGKPPKDKGGKIVITEAEKKRAEEMYEGVDISLKEKYKWFLEQKAHEANLDKPKE